MIIIVVFLLGIISISISAEEAEFSFEQLENPTSVEELLEKFLKVEFLMTEKRNGDLIRKNKITINYEGKEEINDTLADKLIVQGSGTDKIPAAQIWFDEDEVVKLVIDNQELPPAMAQDFVDGILSSVLAPFMYFKDYNLVAAEEFKTADISKRNRKLGGKEVEIIDYDMENLNDYGLKSGVISIAEFEDFSLIENYKVLSLDDLEVNYRLEAIEFN